MSDVDQRLTEGAVRAQARMRMFFILRKAWKRRAAEGMTAKALAARLGRDKAQVSRVLNGSVPTITLETLALFLDGLDHQLIIDCRAAEDVPLSNSAAPRTEPDAGSVAHLEDKRARSA